jgi:undecaprenyl-diphosphatase
MRNPKILLLVLLAGFIACKNIPSFYVSGAAAQKNAEAVESISSNWTAVNSFDLSVINFFQKFSHKNEFIDNFFMFFTYNNFFQGGVLLIVFWWLWFLPDEEKQHDRRVKIILALISNFVAIFIGRIIVHVTPERLRPLNNPELSLVLPFGVHNNYVDNLSSFPSDHAVLFYSIATGLWIVSRRAGIGAFIYTSVFIILTRIYCCYHYATDVIAGAIVGIAVTYLICENLWAQRMGEKIYAVSRQKPQFFYPFFFVISYQLSNLFEELRNAMAFFLHSVHLV